MRIALAVVALILELPFLELVSSQGRRRPLLAFRYMSDYS